MVDRRITGIGEIQFCVGYLFPNFVTLILFLMLKIWFLITKFLNDFDRSRKDTMINKLWIGPSLSISIHGPRKWTTYDKFMGWISFLGFNPKLKNIYVMGGWYLWMWWDRGAVMYILVLVHPNHQITKQTYNWWMKRVHLPARVTDLLASRNEYTWLVDEAKNKGSPWDKRDIN